MKLKLIFAVAALSALSLNLHSQATPAGQIVGTSEGNIWAEVGTITPIEKNNVIFSTGVHQGYDLYDFKFLSLTPFVSGGATLDTRGYVWNNQLIASAGAQLNAAVPHGIISVGGAYAVEDRYKEPLTAGAPTYFIQDWFGWQTGGSSPSFPHTHPAKDPNPRFPGSTWASYGYLVPAERYNRLFYGFVQQGVVAGHFFGHEDYPVILFAEATAGFSSQRFDWDNFTRPGAGVKIKMPRGFEVGASYLHEQRPISHEQANGVSFFLKFDTNWTLLGTRR